jgi:hypothetical protein
MHQQIVRLTQEVTAAEVHSDSPAEEAKNIALLDKLSTDHSTHTHGHSRVQSKTDDINDLKTAKSRIGAISLIGLQARTSEAYFVPSDPSRLALRKLISCRQIRHGSPRLCIRRTIGHRSLR